MDIFRDQALRLAKLQGERTMLDLAKQQLRNYVVTEVSHIDNIRVHITWTGMSDFREGDGFKYMRVILRLGIKVAQFDCTYLDQKQLNYSINTSLEELTNELNI